MSAEQAAFERGFLAGFAAGKGQAASALPPVPACIRVSDKSSAALTMDAIRWIIQTDGKLSAQKAAKRLGVSEPSVSRYRNATRKPLADLDLSLRAIMEEFYKT